MTFPEKRSWLLAAGLGVLAACASLAARNRTPTDSDVIRMSHKQHQEAEVECRACHGAIYTSTTLAGRQMPKERTCLKCHADWKEEGKCNTCHLTAKPETWPARERVVNFSHDQHLPLTEENCARCHKELPEPGRQAQSSPPMSVCLDCHNHKTDYDQGRCQPCHVDLTRVPLRPVSSYSHQVDYTRRHRLDARTSPETCAQCHDQHYCKDCHARTVSTQVEFKFPERVDRQFIHRNDYLSRHHIEASADPALCQRCHGRSFCNDCHKKQNFTEDSVNPHNPHPVGWMFPNSGSFHGPAARRDIVSCAGCHDQGANSNCVGCHRVGGPGGNPHPPAFLKENDRGDLRSRPCGICHSL